MTRHTTEDYVRAVLEISSRADSARASTGELARWLGVTRGTASRMIRVLARAGLVVFTSYDGAQLTPLGHRLAIKLLRHHRLLELFLAKTLALDWDQVHDEAARLQHVVSDELIERIDAYLGHPESDPHGDPIPRRDGSFPPSPGVALLGCAAGTSFVVVRVLDQIPPALRFLSSVGIAIGTTGQVIENLPDAESVRVSLGGTVASISRSMAGKLLVKLATS
jgi:DtxR family transcriptional regulator, Mn-dependent transcriptional regulator